MSQYTRYTKETHGDKFEDRHLKDMNGLYHHRLLKAGMPFGGTPTQEQIDAAHQIVMHLFEAQLAHEKESGREFPSKITPESIAHAATWPGHRRGETNE